MDDLFQSLPGSFTAPVRPRSVKSEQAENAEAFSLLVTSNAEPTAAPSLGDREGIIATEPISSRFEAALVDLVGQEETSTDVISPGSNTIVAAFPNASFDPIFKVEGGEILINEADVELVTEDVLAPSSAQFEENDQKIEGIGTDKSLPVANSPLPTSAPITPMPDAELDGSDPPQLARQPSTLPSAPPATLVPLTQIQVTDQKLQTPVDPARALAVPDGDLPSLTRSVMGDRAVPQVHAVSAARLADAQIASSVLQPQHSGDAAPSIPRGDEDVPTEHLSKPKPDLAATTPRPNQPAILPQAAPPIAARNESQIPIETALTIDETEGSVALDLSRDLQGSSRADVVRAGMWAQNAASLVQATQVVSAAPITSLTPSGSADFTVLPEVPAAGELAIAATSVASTAVAQSVGPSVAPPPTMAHAAAQQIVAALSDPNHEPGGTIELSLDPPELGRVRLQVTEVAGVMTLTIQAERPETVDLMRRHLDLLSDEFARSGLEEPSVKLSQDGANSRNESQPSGGEELGDQDPEHVDDLTVANDNMRSGTSALDLRL